MRLILSSSVLKNMANQSSNCLNCVQSPYSRISALSCIKSDRVSHAIAVAAIYAHRLFPMRPESGARSKHNGRFACRIPPAKRGRAIFSPAFALQRERKREREREREKAINNPDCCTWRFV